MARLAAPGCFLAQDGFLVACSCRPPWGGLGGGRRTSAGFVEAVRKGLNFRGEALRPRPADQRCRPRDHPVHPLLPESAYLKALFLQLD